MEALRLTNTFRPHSMHDSGFKKMKHTCLQLCFLFAICVDMSGVSLKDRRIAMVSLLDNLQDNSMIMCGRRFRIIFILTDMRSKYIARLFDKETAASIHVSNLSTRNMCIAYKRDKDNFAWLDKYICQPFGKLLLSKLCCCNKRFIFLDFNQVNSNYQVSHTWDKVRCSINGIDGHTLPVAFPDLQENTVIVVSDNYYDTPAIPSEWQGLHDGKDVSVHLPKQQARYYQFSHRSTRLATFANTGYFTDPQIFAELGFFYRGQGDSVSCYECGISLSQWQKDDDPLLEHIRFSPECQHLGAIIDSDTLEDYKAQLQKTRVDEQALRGIRQDKTTSNSGRKIRSPQYVSYSVRLLTFANFPFVSGLNIHHVAAAGFYYTGHDDTVRCYACDGGLKQWEPGDDPWEEHFKWFPDCLHLEQSDFKSQRKPTKEGGQPNLKSSRKLSNPEESNIKFQGKASVLVEEKSAQGGLGGKLHGLKIGEIKENGHRQKQLSEQDLSTPAVLAVLEFGYSLEKVKMAIDELRENGQSKVTVNGILQVLLSHEEKNTLPVNREREKNENKTSISVSKSIPAKNISSEARCILKEMEDLKAKMICKRCKKNQRNMLLLPCTHFCLCVQCSKEVVLCPECWKPIVERVKTYIS